MNHLEDEGPAGAHLDFPDVETESQQRFHQGALPVRLATQGHDLRDRQLLPERHRRRLEAVVRLEAAGLGG